MTLSIASLFRPRHLPGYAALVFLAYLAYLGQAYWQGFEAAKAGRTPLLTDFTTTYGAALLVWQAPPETLYFPPAIDAANRAAAQAAYFWALDDEQIGSVIGPWMYPPPAIFFLFPLGLLPYHFALLAMLLITAVPYFLAAHRWLPEKALGFWIALAAPPTFYLLMFGQTSFWPVGLIALGLGWLPQRPVWAGIAIGLASIKPHLGLLVPVALIAGGHWRAFWSACATVFALMAASLVAFGIEPWYAFIGRSWAAIEGFAREAYAWRSMASTLAFAKSLGVSLPLAEKFQWLVTVLALLATAWLWRKSQARPETLAVRSAWLLAASIVVVPMSFLYDLVALTLAGICLIADGRERPAPSWLTPAVSLAILATLFAKPAGWAGPLVAASSSFALMGLAAWRILTVSPSKS